MFEGFLRYLNSEWKVIGQAPFTFLIALAIAGGVIWVVARGAVREQLANLRSALELRDRQIGDYKDKLSGASPSEAAHRMADLEARLAKLEPRVLSPEQVARLSAVINGVRLGIAINRDVDGSNVDPLYRQVVEVFRRAGWAIQDGVVFGEDGPPCGVRLIARNNTSEVALATIRSGLQAANLEFVEQFDGSPSNHTLPQILFSSPFEPARWG